MVLDMAFVVAQPIPCFISPLSLAQQAALSLTEDWDRASAETPNIVRIAPAGPLHIQDLNDVGGVSAIIGELGRTGHLDLTALTCHGTMEEWVAACPAPDGEVVRTVENAYSPDGGLKVMHGNLAPDCGVVKKSAVAPEMWQHSGPARVFNSEEEACQGNLWRKDQSWRCGSYSLTKVQLVVLACAKCSPPLPLFAAWD